MTQRSSRSADGRATVALVGLLATFVFLLATWLFSLQREVSHVTAQHEDLRDSEATLSALQLVPERLKRVEDMVEALARTGFKEAREGLEKKVVEKRLEVQEAHFYAGVWNVRFSRGTSGEMVIRAVDETTFAFTGTEEKESGSLKVRGIGEIVARTGELAFNISATSEKGKPYRAITILKPSGANSLKGYFENDLGEFDIVTLTRRTYAR